MSINHTKNPNAKRPSHELLETEEDDEDFEIDRQEEKN